MDFSGTSEKIGSGANQVSDVSIIFSDFINKTIVWFGKLTWYEWLLIFFIIILIFGIIKLKKMSEEKLRPRFRFKY